MKILKQHIGKILGLLLGGLLYFPIGLLLGLGIGFFLDILLQKGGGRGPKRRKKQLPQPNDSINFILSSLILAAAVVKSDGEVEELELSYIQKFLVEQFGQDNLQEYMGILSAALEQDWDMAKTCRQIYLSSSYETRLQMLYFLFGIANADYSIDQVEVDTIKRISLELDLPHSDFVSIKAMFYDEMDSHYKILELPPSASDAQLKAAYRKMVKKYHPDSLASLGEEFQKVGESKFKRLQEAYDTICEKRGLK
ncbi:TerB family tellurite resistance protein [Saprospira grandis]|uniref:TerB family tellurite resistance protein n=1 Tax=Saprospira grandis TaxID=1008 RepID=UPI0022DE4C0D|nr:TerB family tellurite resistance protein [Saprospira grandis]WBM75523.1 molecular chaperone DjiA [Saprospira grandis]